MIWIYAYIQMQDETIKRQLLPVFYLSLPLGSASIHFSLNYKLSKLQRKWAEPQLDKSTAYCRLPVSQGQGQAI